MTEPSAAAIPDAIAKIMGEVGSVEKRGRNEFHRYDYATAADILHKLQPLMAKHGLVVMQSESGREYMDNGSAVAISYEFTLVHASGAVWPTKTIQTGLASCKNSKGGFDDKAANKCHTGARKYFLLALFQIPTGDYDDADSDEDKPGGEKRQNGNGTGRKPTPEPRDEPRTEDHAMHIMVPLTDGNVPDWPKWLTLMGAAARGASELSELNGLLEGNDSALEELKKLGPGGVNNHKRLMEVINARKSDLLNDPVNMRGAA